MIDEFLQELAHYESGGLRWLEWGGVAALAGVGLVTLAIVMGRLMGFSLDIGIRYSKDRPRTSPLRNGREKILVADSDPLTREMLVRLLGQIGYTTATVESSRQAMDYMQRNGADLLIMDDATEPDLDGAEACRRIRELRPLQRIVMIAGHASPNRIAVVRCLGVEHYLLKPVPQALLAAAVRTELDRP